MSLEICRAHANFVASIAVRQFASGLLVLVIQHPSITICLSFQLHLADTLCDWFPTHNVRCVNTSKLFRTFYTSALSIAVYSLLQRLLMPGNLPTGSTKLPFAPEKNKQFHGHGLPENCTNMHKPVHIHPLV